jgi:hypothetical protein
VDDLDPGGNVRHLQPELTSEMTFRISKSMITEAGIAVEEFPEKVAQYAVEFKAWALDMLSFAGGKFYPPRKPEQSEYRDRAGFDRAVDRYEFEMAQTPSSLPCPPRAPLVMFIAVGEDCSPDFEIVDDNGEQLQKVI